MAKLPSKTDSPSVFHARDFPRSAAGLPELMWLWEKAANKVFTGSLKTWPGSCKTAGKQCHPPLRQPPGVSSMDVALQIPVMSSVAAVHVRTELGSSQDRES